MSECEFTDAQQQPAAAATEEEVPRLVGWADWGGHAH